MFILYLLDLPAQHKPGQYGWMPNADQSGSICDQISCPDSKCFSIKILNLILIQIDRHWSLLRNIRIYMIYLITHWSRLIGIMHWSVMSWQTKCCKSIKVILGSVQYNLYGFTNPNNVQIWVGGWLGLRKPGVRIPSEEIKIYVL